MMYNSECSWLLNNFSSLAPKEIVEKSMENMHVDVRVFKGWMYETWDSYRFGSL